MNKLGYFVDRVEQNIGYLNIFGLIKHAVIDSINGKVKYNYTDVYVGQFYVIKKETNYKSIINETFSQIGKNNKISLIMY